MRQEPWLLKPHKTKEVLQAHAFRFRKKFGQNFLTEARVPEQMIAAANITRADLVIEIGPGIGTLTQYLCYYAGEVRAIEIDRALLPILEETLAGWDNVKILSGDAMKMDLREVIREGLETLGNRTADCPGEEASEEAEKGSCPGHVRVAANLPYYITTPILMKLLEDELPVASITVMVQKEVAERMRAKPGTPDYGALSLAVQYYAKPEIACVVPPHCFIPQPNVESAVIHLERRTEAERVPVRDASFMFRLIRAAFNQRRKTLVNALRNAQELNLSRENAEAALEASGLPLNVRGEALSLEEFARLSDRLQEN